MIAIKPPTRKQINAWKPKENRPNARQRGYGSEWEKARAVWLAEHPLCEECLRRGDLTADQGNHVDHITPHRGDWGKFWDKSNWQTLCERCHGEKTARGE